MKTNEFLELLKEHQDKNLLFEYSPGKLVRANYHITEVKNITIESVDCGAGTDAWKETIVQLWESPSEKDNREYLTVHKAAGILNKVDKIRPMDRKAEIKFEYSNENFHTAQLFVDDYTIEANNLIVTLAILKTDCKAKEVCGVPEPATEESSCTPGGGCC